MPSKIIAAHGAFRLRKTGEGRNCELVHLSYMGHTISGLPRVIEEQVVEQFYEAEDGLKRLCELVKN